VIVAVEGQKQWKKVKTLENKEKVFKGRKYKNTGGFPQLFLKNAFSTLLFCFSTKAVEKVSAWN